MCISVFCVLNLSPRHTFLTERVPAALAYDAAAAVKNHYARMVTSDASRDAKEADVARTIANQGLIALLHTSMEERRS